MELAYNYIFVKLKPDNVKELYEDMIQHGLAPSYKHDPHCTILFDKRDDITEPLCVLNPLEEFEAFVTGVGYLGLSNDLVFHLTSQPLVQLFHRLTDAGYVHSYGTPLPHMTVLYDSDKYEKLIVEQNMQHWVGKRLLFNRLSFGEKKPKK